MSPYFTSSSIPGVGGLPEGVDPSFLAALPENIRQEVLQEHLGIRNAPHQAATQAASTPPSAPGEPAISLSQVNPEFLAALPPHIQEEVRLIFIFFDFDKVLFIIVHYQIC